MVTLKWHVPTAFLSHRAQPEVVLFWYQMKAHIFLIVTWKFQLQIHYTLAVIAENVPISGIPIFIFLCIFITASSPVSHSYFCPRREYRSNPEVKLYKMCLRGQGRSIKSENAHVKMGTARFKLCHGCWGGESAVDTILISHIHGGRSSFQSIVVLLLKKSTGIKSCGRYSRFILISVWGLTCWNRELKKKMPKQGS